jgi:hypothetical protein
MWLNVVECGETGSGKTMLIREIQPTKTIPFTPMAGPNHPNDPKKDQHDQTNIHTSTQASNMALPARIKQTDVTSPVAVTPPPFTQFIINMPQMLSYQSIP